MSPLHPPHVAAAPGSPTVTDGDPDGRRWVAAWAAPPSGVGLAQGLLGRPVLAQTLRMVVRPLISGDAVRIRLNNAYGSGGPVRIEHATVAHRGDGAAVAPGTLRDLTFGGEPSVSLATGAFVESDAVRLDVQRGQDLLVSLHVLGGVVRPTQHFITNQTSYVSVTGRGDQAADRSGRRFHRARSPFGYSTGWYFLHAVDVRAEQRSAVVVAFGDSITDGYQGRVRGPMESRMALDQNARYPDFLAQRLARLEPERSIGVVNVGISGNQVLSRSSRLLPFGDSALSRFERDALTQPGVTDVIILEGINDLAVHADLTAEDLIEGLATLAQRARQAGLRAHLGTLTPTAGSARAPVTENRRVAVNTWIREQDLTDSVIDFDGALRDPLAPTRLSAPFDSGDHLHPSSAGYRAMAAAVHLPALAQHDESL
ncbi:Lysophospholipase L1 [Promicromonospora umidemergens]|uniref:SGNH/GDSL hydrolase family protein n=2 Tax=Promicromonospora umidemergens TaxID=629679 RepID=A0ABP8XKY9_9MICO|nr:Lysophospholipase L1 [Promicromonospora umidemergens]